MSDWIWLTLSALGAVLALGPALLISRNLRVLYGPLADVLPAQLTDGAVSLLIPARNEARGIAATLRAALASEGVLLEVVVLDDHSTDDTSVLVSEFQRRDPRVRLEHSAPLPSGWNGKQHACWQLAERATHEQLVFIDADVHLAPDGLIRLIATLQHSSAALLSGVPRQITGTLLEQLLIPLIHFILLGFLPLDQMRKSRDASFGAGCGQLFITRRDNYLLAGGHREFATQMHDGILLPRAYRKAGFATDLIDITEMTTCRMYTRNRDVWYGLMKNATEGMGSPKLIVPFSFLLAGGQVLPLLVLLAAIMVPQPGWPQLVAMALATISLLASYGIRIAMAARFHQSLLSVLLHPVGIVLLLAIQWIALARELLGQQSEWKGRRYRRKTAGSV